MGRRRRILIAGGIYHVYNRVSRGAHVPGTRAGRMRTDYDVPMTHTKGPARDAA